MASIGLSGIGISHTDIGGYTDLCLHQIGYERSTSLFQRWIETSAFTDSIFRTHPGSKPDCNVQVNTSAEMIQFFLQFSQIHSALSFYRKELMKEMSETGAPLLRHPWLHYYHSDPQTRDLLSQFFLGPHLFIAPIVSEWENFLEKVKVHFPTNGQSSNNEWTHIWTLQNYSGGSDTEIAAPIGHPAVFLNRTILDSSSDWKTFLQFIHKKN